MKTTGKNLVNGFTIVEILVTVIVIGILMTVVAISYNGVSYKEKIISLESDLVNASDQIKNFQINSLNKMYPTVINDCPTPALDSLCIKPSRSNNFVKYMTKNTHNPQSFILIASSGNTYYKITNRSTPELVEPKNLSAMIVPSIAANGDARGFAVSHDGKNAYVSSDSQITMFNRDQVDGSLSYMNPSTVGGMGYVYGLVVSPDNNSLYAVDTNLGKVHVFKRNANTGSLDIIQSISTNSLTPRNIVVSDDGKSVYVTNANSNTVSMFSRNINDGRLSALEVSTIATGANPQGIAISSDGESVYVACRDSDELYVYDRNPVNSLLTTANPVAMKTESNPRGVVVSPDDGHVYVSNESSGTISIYGRNGTGSLTPISAVNVGPSIGSIAISPDGFSVYATSYTTKTLYMYKRDIISGLIAPMNTPTISTGDYPWTVTVSRDGISVYVTNVGNPDTVSMYDTR